MRAIPITDSVWQRVLARLRPAPIATADALKTFLEERASLIAQKCAIDYCRGKTGLASYALFTEKPFLDALDVCRWEAFVAVLGDLFIVLEGHLRPQVSAEHHPRLCEALVGLHSAALAALPVPTHRPEGWGEASASRRRASASHSRRSMSPSIPRSGCSTPCRFTSACGRRTGKSCTARCASG
jgi:hypothetical protein